MTKKNQTLNDMANAASASRMTYGQYQQAQILSEHNDASHSALRMRQPIFLQESGEYLCPKCGKRLVFGYNCQRCGNAIVWKKIYQ